MLEEKHDLRHLVETSQEAKQVYQLLQSFLHMFCARQQELLNGWMKEARACGIKELGSFVAGVERDYDAVLAGLIYH